MDVQLSASAVKPLVPQPRWAKEKMKSDWKKYNRMICLGALLVSIVTTMLVYISWIHATNAYRDPYWGAVWARGAIQLKDILLLVSPSLLFLIYLPFAHRIGLVAILTVAFVIFSLILDISSEIGPCDLQHGDEMFLGGFLIRMGVALVCSVILTIAVFVNILKKGRKEDFIFCENKEQCDAQQENRTG